MNNKALVRRNFLDSGAFSIYKKARIYGAKNCCSEWAYYETEEFYQYMDAYAAFVKKYCCAIDRFATVDAIMNPKITWRNQKYLEEKHGLRPVPVVHYGTDVKWIQKYIDKGHTFIGLGGLARSVRKVGVRYWLDQCFDLVCQNKERLPEIKYHGFGFTSYKLAIAYPWYSIDSTVWSVAAGYGNIYVPHRRNGKFVFDVTPYAIKVTDGCKARSVRGQHMETLRKAETDTIKHWLGWIGVPVGAVDGLGNIISEGVSNSANMRRKANLLFFEGMAAAQPPWPWPFKPSVVRRGFGFDMRKR